MKVSAQYAQDHLAELLESAERGEEVEIDREGKPSARLFIVPAPTAIESEGARILGAGRGEIVLPTDAEWKAMDEEIADLMLNGPLFPEERA